MLHVLDFEWKGNCEKSDFLPSGTKPMFLWAHTYDLQSWPTLRFRSLCSVFMPAYSVLLFASSCDSFFSRVCCLKLFAQFLRLFISVGQRLCDRTFLCFNLSLFFLIMSPKTNKSKTPVIYYIWSYVFICWTLVFLIHLWNLIYFFLYSQTTSTEKITYKIKFLSDLVKNCIFLIFEHLLCVFPVFLNFFLFYCFLLSNFDSTRKMRKLKSLLKISTVIFCFNLSVAIFKAK